MLKNSLYKIISSDHKENSIKAVLEIDAANELFLGHFPGQPILPGACMLQMVKEVLEAVFEKKVRLKKANQLKFLKMVDPTSNNLLKLDLIYNLEGGLIHLTASMASAGDVCLKMKGDFVFI